MKKKVIGIIVAILLIVITFCGCLDNNDSSDDLLIEQIKTNFSNALKEVTSYKCNITGQVNSSYINEGITYNIDRLSNSNLLVDYSNYNLKQEIDFLNVNENETEKTITYIIDNFKYNGVGKEGNITWEYEDMSPQVKEGIWNITSKEFGILLRL
jgi:hypothetical protein